MSADFWSFAVAMKPAHAKAMEKKLRAMETVDPIVDGKGGVLHRFSGKTAEPDVDAVGKACRGKAPKDIGRAYVDASIDDLEPLLESTILMSSGYASVVVLDRALALPHGVDLMGGHAVRALSFSRLMKVSDQMSGVAGALGPKKVIATLAKHLERSGTGEADAQELWDLWLKAMDATFREDASLLLVGAVAP